jgi:hypothetical protein
MDINEIFATLYESFYYSEPFSGDLYQEGLYSSIGLSGILISLFFVVAFYFIINRPHFSRWYHWLIILVVNLIIAFAIGIIFPQNKFVGLGIEYDITEYLQFGLINSVISSLFFIVWTYLLKWWKGAAKGTPKLFFGKF